MAAQSMKTLLAPIFMLLGSAAFAQDQPANLKELCILAEVTWSLWDILSKMYFNISQERFIGALLTLDGSQVIATLPMVHCLMEQQH